MLLYMSCLMSNSNTHVWPANELSSLSFSRPLLSEHIPGCAHLRPPCPAVAPATDQNSHLCLSGAVSSKWLRRCCLRCGFSCLYLQFLRFTVSVIIFCKYVQHKVAWESNEAVCEVVLSVVINDDNQHCKKVWAEQRWACPLSINWKITSSSVDENPSMSSFLMNAK